MVNKLIVKPLIFKDFQLANAVSKLTTAILLASLDDLGLDDLIQKDRSMRSVPESEQSNRATLVLDKLTEVRFAFNIIIFEVFEIGQNNNPINV